jgi:uncharacterized protein YbaP (TraB family)
LSASMILPSEPWLIASTLCLAPCLSDTSSSLRFCLARTRAAVLKHIKGLNCPNAQIGAANLSNRPNQ